MVTENQSTWAVHIQKEEDASDSTEIGAQQINVTVSDKTEAFEKTDRNPLLGIVNYLLKENSFLTRKFVELQEQNNRELSALRREITRLRKTMEEIEIARTLVEDIPDSWILDED